jgi:metal-responsive CopG/Arc/MetJ family transcriptional regulator
MPKDKKEARLSFRITNELSEDIDKVVDQTNKIKDRSDFGTKAVSYYIAYLREELNIRESMKNAIIALSKEINAEDLPDVVKLQELIEKRNQM